MTTAMTPWQRLVPASLRHTLALRAFGLRQVAMLAYCRPVVTAVDQGGVSIKIPLRRRTRNHLGSMYFGALAVGADCAAGYAAMEAIRLSGRRVALVFKDLHAHFLRRPEADVLFTCADGLAIAALVARAVGTGERVEQEVGVVATTPSRSGDEPVARFTLTISLKLRA